jgi:hypothetical protein
MPANPWAAYDEAVEESRVTAPPRSVVSPVLLAALAIGLAVAGLPVLVTRDRPCASPAIPRANAPAHLVLTADRRIEELRCEANGDLAFMRVRTAAEVDVRLAAVEVSGVILDHESYERLRPGQIREWLTVGTGRTMIGLDLTAGQLRADTGGAVPPDSRLPSPYLGDSCVSHLSSRTSPQGNCGGGGTTPYRGPRAARALIDRLLEWALRDCGAA